MSDNEHLHCRDQLPTLSTLPDHTLPDDTRLDDTRPYNTRRMMRCLRHRMQRLKVRLWFKSPEDSHVGRQQFVRIMLLSVIAVAIAVPVPVGTIAGAQAALSPAAAALTPLATVDAPAGSARIAHWQWPIRGQRSVATWFASPPTPYGRGHRGIDIAFRNGIVLSPDDGIVTFAGPVAGRGVITITYANGLKSSIEPVTTELTAGTHVTRGEPIAEAVAGHAKCPQCIHFGVRRGDTYVNPMLCFEQVAWSVLKPSQ